MEVWSYDSMAGIGMPRLTKESPYRSMTEFPYSATEAWKVQIGDSKWVQLKMSIMHRISDHFRRQRQYYSKGIGQKSVEDKRSDETTFHVNWPRFFGKLNRYDSVEF